MRPNAKMFSFPAAADHAVTKIIPETTALIPYRRIIFVLFLLVATCSFVFLYKVADSLPLIPQPLAVQFAALHYIIPSADDNFALHSEESRLEVVLKKASMKDNTVILTTLNEAWAASNSVIDLFLESFRIGDCTHKLLNHLVIIALDQKAFARCLVLHTHCFALVTEGVNFSAEASYMSTDYLKMMWRRIDFLHSVLELGYNFVFTDADIMWFRNPFKRFYLDADFQIACDHFLGNSFMLENSPNGGFKYVKSNNRSLAFYKFWHSSRLTHPGFHDQAVLNIIKYDPYIWEIGVRIRFLDTSYFGGICEPSRDFNEVCTMHANCCIGLDNKLHDLRIMIQDWKRFVALPPRLRKTSFFSWRVPQNCSVDFPQNYDTGV